MRAKCDETIYLTSDEQKSLVDFSWIIRDIYEIVETEELKSYCTTIIDYLGKLDNHIKIGV